MWGHAASFYSFGLPRPQVLFYGAAPCQYPSRPQLVPKVSSSWRIWHLSSLKSHWSISPPVYIFSHFFQLLHFQSNTIRLPHLLCSWGFSLCHLPRHSIPDLCSASPQQANLAPQQTHGCSKWGHLRMSAFRLPPQPCWDNPPLSQMQLLDTPKSEGSQGKRCLHVLA